MLFARIVIVLLIVAVVLFFTGPALLNRFIDGTARLTAYAERKIKKALKQWRDFLGV